MGEIFIQQHIGTVVIDWAAFLILLALIWLNVLMIQTIVIFASIRRWLKQQLR